MKLHQILFLTVLSGFLSFNAIGQEPDNKKPMYGNIAKSEQYKKIDNEFIAHSLKQFGSIDSATKVYIDHAWRYFYNSDLETAMKRFNQAWLLNAEYPDSYFGFAALLELQHNLSEADKFYEIALEKDNLINRASQYANRK